MGISKQMMFEKMDQISEEYCDQCDRAKDAPPDDHGCVCEKASGDSEDFNDEPDADEPDCDN